MVFCAKRPGKRAAQAVGCEDDLCSTLFSITKPQPSAIAQAHDKDMAQGGRTPRITDLAAWALDLRCSRWHWEKQGTTPPVRTWTPQARTLLPRLPGLSKGGIHLHQGRRQDGARYRAMLCLARPRVIPLAGY